MESPICKVCLKNEILCSACADIVGQNEIKVKELKLFRKMNKLTRKIPILKEVEIKRIVGKNNLLIVTRKEDVSKLIGKEGIIAKKLSNELGAPIRVIAKPSTLREFVEEILYFVPVLGINVVYDEEWEKHRIRVPKQEENNLPFSPEIILNLSRSLFGVNTEIIFE